MARTVSPDPAVVPSAPPARVAPSAALELLKPITWFPPMWAFACGVVSSGVPLAERWPLALAGVVLAGPLVCGASQIINDWCDRHVDAINQPERAIPSGRAPGRWAFYYAIFWSLLCLLVAALLGVWVFSATVLGLLLAWMYSSPPLRLKQNGWWGNAAVAVSYEGLAWLTGAAVMLSAAPAAEIFALAALYSIGAHGIMTLNDFKAIDGDWQMGVRSLPVQLGAARAARLACAVMTAPQLAVIALLFYWAAPLYAGAVALLLLAQLFCMRTLLRDPLGRAPWYNATGVSLYVLGMLVSAFALRAAV